MDSDYAIFSLPRFIFNILRILEAVNGPGLTNVQGVALHVTQVRFQGGIQIGTLESRR